MTFFASATVANHPLPSAPVDGATLGAVAQLMLDEIGCGLIVCDPRHGIVYANPSALQELQAAQVLQRVDGLLQAAPGTDAQGFDDALQQATLRGRRCLLQLGSGEARLMVALLPLRLPDRPTPRVLVMLGRRHACSELGIELLGTSAGLTLTERRVLSALVHGATPREVARQHGVALSTVRTQISSVRGKLGARSIEGLLLRAAEVPPLAHALRLASGAAAPVPRAVASDEAMRVAA